MNTDSVKMEFSKNRFNLLGLILISSQVICGTIGAPFQMPEVNYQSNYYIFYTN